MTTNTNAKAALKGQSSSSPTPCRRLPPLPPKMSSVACFASPSTGDLESNQGCRTNEKGKPTVEEKGLILLMEKQKALGATQGGTFGTTSFSDPPSSSPISPASGSRASPTKSTSTPGRSGGFSSTSSATTTGSGVPKGSAQTLTRARTMPKMSSRSTTTIPFAVSTSGPINRW